MVRTVFFILAVIAGLTVSAQKFDPNDTVTEYTMHGTMYHNRFEGRKTAHGDIFNHNLFTAAHNKFKFGTLLLVTSKKTGQTVIVKVNDRCPKKNVLDMTRRAAYGIGIKGCQLVTVRVLPPSYEEEWASQDSKYDSVASRFATGKYALSNSSKEKKTTKKHKEDNGKGEKYNISLGFVQTHGEAFEQISTLPEEYRDKVLVDTTGDGQLGLLLDVKLTKGEAQRLNRTLKGTFPDAKIIPSE